MAAAANHYPPTLTERAQAATKQLVDCRGKASFETRTLAEGVSQRSRRRNGQALNAYRCPHCDNWHVGHRSNRR